jgi:hypothetical protein
MPVFRLYCVGRGLLTGSYIIQRVVPDVYKDVSEIPEVEEPRLHWHYCHRNRYHRHSVHCTLNSK